MKKSSKLKLGIICFDLQAFTEDLCFRIAEATKDQIDLTAYPLFYHKQQTEARVPFFATQTKAKILDLGGNSSTQESVAKNLNLGISFKCAKNSDIIMLYGLQGAAALWASIFGRFFGKKIIAVTHACPVNTELQRTWWIRAVKRIIYALSNVNVCQSLTSKECLSKIYGMNEGELILAPFEAGSRSFSAKVEKNVNKPEDIRRKHGLGSEPIFLFVGNLIPMKGVDVLIKAVAKLTFDFKLIIVGRDSETGQAGADYLRQLAKELQVSDKIIFIRELSHSDLIDLYKIADLFVLPTRKDHTPKVMVEAGLMSKAMITTTSCGFSKDLIEEGISGYVVATDDVDALAAALNKCQDREKLQRFGERSRELVQHLCDPEKETAGFVEAIERVRGYK